MCPNRPQIRRSDWAKFRRESAHQFEMKRRENWFVRLTNHDRKGQGGFRIHRFSTFPLESIHELVLKPIPDRKRKRLGWLQGLLHS